MQVDIITIFPEIFEGPFNTSIIKRAQDKGLIKINLHDLRKWAIDKRGTVDDRPYGGGTGMILLVEPIVKGIEEIKSKIGNIDKRKVKIVLLGPKGKQWNQTLARKYSSLEYLILICGHYEGVDERVRNFIDEEISVGDYILTGGEIPAMILVDSITRLIPGVLEKEEATKKESFSEKEGCRLLEYPQYTRPAQFRGLKVPEILLSGNHQEIEKWRKEQSLKITKKERPDLLKE